MYGDVNWRASVMNTQIESRVLNFSESLHLTRLLGMRLTTFVIRGLGYKQTVVRTVPEIEIRESWDFFPPLGSSVFCGLFEGLRAFCGLEEFLSQPFRSDVFETLGSVFEIFFTFDIC